MMLVIVIRMIRSRTHIGVLGKAYKVTCYKESIHLHSRCRIVGAGEFGKILNIKGCIRGGTGGIGGGISGCGCGCGIIV